MSDREGIIPLDPIEPTQIAPNVAVIPLAPTVWDDLPDGQHAVTPDGTVWQRSDGLWHMDPWYQRDDGEQIIAVCANPGKWAYGNGWPRKMVEEWLGALTPITLPASYPHDDERCRRESVDAAGFRQVCIALGRIAVAAGLPDGLSADEAADLVIRRLSTPPGAPS